MRTLEDGAGANGEFLTASPAPVVAEPLALAGGDFLASAMRAMHMPIPPPLLKVESGSLRIREHPEKLESADGDVVVHGLAPSISSPF